MSLNSQPEREKPRNLKQVQNVAVHEASRSGSVADTCGKGNLADDIQSLCSDVLTSDFVQGVYIIKGHAPSVVLYIQEQINDIRRFCSHGAVNATKVEKDGLRHSSWQTVVSASRPTTSSDGQLTVQGTNGVARKGNQTQRPRGHRSHHKMT